MGSAPRPGPAAAPATTAPVPVARRRSSDARVALAAGAALVLQVAHPTVAAGVREHSDFEREPWGRLLRTLDYATLLVYGGPEASARTARATRELHRRIRGVTPEGRRYSALEPEAYAWVHATLVEMVVAAHAVFGRPLAPGEVERLYAEWRALGGPLGVRERDLPATWAGFRAYVDATVAGTLEDGDVVQAVLRTLARPVAPPVPVVPAAAWRPVLAPASALAGLTTAALLPPVLRERVGLPWTARHTAALRAVATVTRHATPPVLRCTGPLYLRVRRRAIAAGPFG